MDHVYAAFGKEPAWEMYKDITYTAAVRRQDVHTLWRNLVPDASPERAAQAAEARRAGTHVRLPAL